jgi:MEMO1 family protein
MFHKVCVFVMGIAFACMASQTLVRLPAMAGQFYPASPKQLRQDIETYLSNVKQANLPQTSKFMGFIVPHAGYQYSGQTAAYAYNILKDHKYDVIILIGPYHKDMFTGVSIWPEGIWKTPLGEVTIDSELARTIQNESADFSYDYQIHLSEHSLEVQVPFLQMVNKEAKIVPILISDLAYAKPLAKALYKHLVGRSVIVLASTDLSHYHPDETARQIDERTQKVFKTLSPDTFKQAYQKGDIELCGAAAVLTLLELNQLYGQGELTILHYANSGDQFSDKSNVVGYNASLISLPEKISSKQGQLLLSLAKETLHAYLTNQASPSPTIDDPILNEKRAVFVTLRDKTGQLRGCIGRFVAEEPLYLAVQHMAIEAATKDSRFVPLNLTELKNLSIEISVLDEPIKIATPNEIMFGKHGVILAQGNKSGIFLPDVAKEIPTREEFLSELCFQKADLPRNCWQNPSTQLSVFTTQIIDDNQ